MSPGMQVHYGAPGQAPDDPRLIVPVTEADAGKTISFWIGNHQGRGNPSHHPWRGAYHPKRPGLWQAHHNQVLMQTLPLLHEAVLLP